MKFGDNLKKLRKSKNISQEDLAEKVNVSRQSVSKWECGDAYPEMNNILELCKIFHCNINDLVNDTIVDIDSLDEDVKMSVVKFKAEKQRKMKGLSKAVCIFAKIGSIIMAFGIGVMLLAMIFTPVVVSKATVNDKHLKIADVLDEDITFEKKGDELIVRADGKKVSESDEKTIVKIQKIFKENSKKVIIINLEIGFAFLIIFFVIILITCRYLEKLFNNINKGDTPFTLENVKYIKKIAYLLIASIIISMCGQSSFEFLLGTDVEIDINMVDIIQILFLFSMAYIFEYGYEIQLDSKGKIYGDENE